MRDVLIKLLMDYFTFLIYQFLTGLLARLPLTFIFRVGTILGAIVYYLSGKYRRLVIRNLNIAFEGEKSPKEIQQFAKDHFSTLGANLLSSFKLSQMSMQEIGSRIRWENLEIFTETLKKGSGTVYVVSHIGNWELLVRIPEFVPKQRYATIYQKLGNRFIDAEVKKMRANQGVELIERKEGFNQAMKILREGGGLGILVDQHAGDAGIWTPVFNRLASTSPLAATLALRTDANIVPVAIYTDGIARWKCVVSPHIVPGEHDNIETVTGNINSALESQIRVSPPDWFWVHNRWKTPSPRFLLTNYKRGIHIPKNRSSESLKPFRMLIRSSNWLGDAVMTVPAIRAIKQGRPDAQVTILTRAKLADFWKLVPEVDAVISIEKNENIFRVAKKIGSTFDAAILFPNSIRSALEVWLAGIPRRVGFESKFRRKLLNQILRKDHSGRPPEHQTYHYLRLAEFIGAFKKDELRERHDRFIQRHAPRVNFRIGLCPGAEYGPAKRWLPERFAEVIATVSQQKECEWVLFGTEKDQPIGEQILGVKSEEPIPEVNPTQETDSTGISEPAITESTQDVGIEIPTSNIPAFDFKNCINRIGKTTLTELITELSQCHVLLTNDTGTMHLAAFLGVPTISIFGSTEPVLTGPIGSGHQILRHHAACSPCFLRECPLDFRCMNSIKVEEVVEAVLKALESA